MNIYQRYEALSPIYQGGLTNHLPMVFTILKKMGINNDDLIKKLDSYKEEKGLLDLTDHLTPISDFEQEYINLTSKYLGEINHKGEDIIIGEFINKFKWNIEAALFHGLIRLAYAKQENNPLLVAQAMAYFELSIPKKEEVNKQYCKQEEFMEKHISFYDRFKDLEYSMESKSTMEKYEELMSLELVSNNLYMLKDISKEFVLDFILKYFVKTKCFYTLHLITGFEALIEMEEYIFDFKEVLNHFFVTAQVFVLFNTMEIEELLLQDKEIEELLNKMNQLTDFHDIKLLFSLYKLNKLFDHELLKPIANRVITE